MHLPLFPLSLVVFPGKFLNLHIFEPRYRSLVLEAEETGIRFGIPCYSEDIKMTHGTEVELLEISKHYDDGKMDIKTRANRIFKIIDYHSTMNGKLYPGGEVQFLDNIFEGDIVLVAQIIQKLKLLYKTMKIDKPIPVVGANFTVYDIAHKIGLSFQQEKQLLLIDNELERQRYVDNHLNALIPIVNEMETMRKKIQMNGHFKNIQPPSI